MTYFRKSRLDRRQTSVTRSRWWLTHRKRNGWRSITFRLPPKRNAWVRANASPVPSDHFRRRNRAAQRNCRALFFLSDRIRRPGSKRKTTKMSELFLLTIVLNDFIYCFDDVTSHTEAMYLSHLTTHVNLVSQLNICYVLPGVNKMVLTLPLVCLAYPERKVRRWILFWCSTICERMCTTTKVWTVCFHTELSKLIN